VPPPAPEEHVEAEEPAAPDADLRAELRERVAARRSVGAKEPLTINEGEWLAEPTG
jgi:hypothetical protein